MFRFRKLFCRKQMLRDLYEIWLILAVGMLVRWNRLRLLEELPPSPLVASGLALRNGANYRLGDMFFGAGLLAFLLQYRCHWVRRCQHRVQLLLLALELWFLLRIVEFNDRVAWQPFLGIYRDMFETLGHADYRIYRLAPGLATWLTDGSAYEVFQLLVSFAFFVVGMSTAAEDWIKTVDLLVLGHGPENPVKRRRANRQGRYVGQPLKPTPDRLMAQRLCSACLKEALRDVDAILVPERRK